MKVKCEISIEFEPSDNEKCGNNRKVSCEFTGSWSAVSDAVGQSLSMIHVPRAALVVAKLMDELGIEAGSATLSSQMATAANAVIEAFEEVDRRVSCGESCERVLDAMVII